MFIKINNNEIEKYPYSDINLINDYPNTSFPIDLNNADLSEFGVFKVTVTEKPLVDHTQIVEESNPILQDGVWTQVWTIRPALPAELSAAMESLTRKFTDAIQQHLDLEAQTRNYANIISACSYAAGAHPKYSVEGQACLAWRESVWDTAYEILADVQAGTRPVPTLEEVISELPQMVWPTL